MIERMYLYKILKALILTSAHQQEVQGNKQCNIQSSNKAISKGNLAMSIKNVFTNKNVNYVYLTRSSFYIFVVLSCIKVFKVVIYIFLAYSTLS